MKNQPLISIIMPVYNAEKFLKNSIDSVLKQTYENWELILIDDGSTDGSGKICDDFAKKDKRVKVIHQKNAGIAAAQNAGLKKMSGKYVTFMDNDDLILPHAIERLYAMISKNKADLATCRWFNVGESTAEVTYREHSSDGFGDIITYQNPLEKYEKIHSVLSRKLHKNGDFYYLNEANWGKLYDAKLWKNVKFPDGQYAQDMWVAADIYPRIKKAVATTDKLYLWIQHSKSVSHNTKTRAYHLDIFNATKRAFIKSVEMKIIPIRSYGSITVEYKKFLAPDKKLKQEIKELKKILTKKELFLCFWFTKIRVLETFVYNLTKHRQK